MPGKIKVKVLAGRNLPVMDRAGDTTDAFVEIKFGSVTHKTDVCRKSLNPHWNSTEWYRFEVDESELQDEPLQLRLMDHDTYSANDAIGKVVISLAPLLAREANNVKSTTTTHGGAVMSGWIPVFDTMHGIRGELNIIVKVELFSDFNKYKTSSCGVQFFHCRMIPPGYRATAIHGFVEELVVNDDPEYQWIDKIRTPRASNEARQVAFIKLSNQVQRLVGLKAAELGANAVVGYQQDFDLEGEAGVVARAIGTAVSITPLPTPSQQSNMPVCTQQQLKKYLDILATDNESISDLNEYYQTHQEELQKMLNILGPNASSLLDEADMADDDDRSMDMTRHSSITSYADSVSIYQDEYIHHKSLKHISEDQTDLNKLLNKDSDDSDSSGPLQKIKKIKTNFFTKRFGSKRSKKSNSEKQDDQISLRSNSSDNSRISLVDIKNEFKKFKRLKKPKFRKVINKEDEGQGMASILARSVIHVHTSLACIAETQDSEHSPGSTMRRTSESEPTINLSDEENGKSKEMEDIMASTKKPPEIRFSSLNNLSSDEVPESRRQRKLSESCPTSPTAGRSENVLNIPDDQPGSFGSISSALSADSSELETTSDEDDESSDLKTDTEKSIETTSSVVHTVMNQKVDPTMADQMDRKSNIQEHLHPDVSAVTPEIKKEDNDEVKVKQYVHDTLELPIDKSMSLETVPQEILNKDLKEKQIKSVEASTSSIKDETCVTKPHFKFHNPFAHKKASKSISAPSSPVEKSSFVYRSSKRIKRQISKISNSNMIKSISHYSLHPKKKDVKTPLSHPGSSTDIASKAHSDTVLGTPFMSYNDLLSLDKETHEGNKLFHRSDELDHVKVSMYIGSEPVSRASLTGSLYPAHREDNQDYTKSAIKPIGLVHTAMETILLDKVQSLLMPTSPDPDSKKTQQFFDDVNEKLGQVEEYQTKNVPLEYLVDNAFQGPARSASQSPPVNTKPVIVNSATIYKDKNKNSKYDPSGLVKTAIQTMLVDKAQSAIITTASDLSKHERVFNVDDDKKHTKSKAKKPLGLIQSLLGPRTPEPSTPTSPTEKFFKKKELKSTGMVHTAIETILMEKVQSVLGPETPQPMKPSIFDVYDNEKSYKTYSKPSLVQTAMETMLLDRVQASALGTNVEPVIPTEPTYDDIETPITGNKHDEVKGITHLAMETMLIDKVQSLVGQELPVEDTNEPPIDEHIKSEMKPAGLVQTAMEAILLDKAQTSGLGVNIPEPLITDTDKTEDFKDHSQNLDSTSLTHTAMETILLDKVHSLVGQSGMTFVQPQQFTEEELNIDKGDEDLKSPGLVKSAVQTILLDKVQSLMGDNVISINQPQNLDTSTTLDTKVTEENLEKSSLFGSALEIILLDKVQTLMPVDAEPAEPLITNLHESKTESNSESVGLVNTVMKTMLIDKVQCLLPTETENTEKPADQTTVKTNENNDKEIKSDQKNNNKKLIRQDSVHSVAEESPKMSVANPSSDKPHCHPKLGDLETIPSLPEGSVEETNNSVCNSHAVWDVNREKNDRREKEDRSDKDRGSPKHSRHESYGGREPQNHAQNSSLNASSTPMGIHRRSSDSDLSVTPKGGSLNTSAGNVGSGGGAILRPSMNSNNLDMLEYPFLTMSEYPPGFIVHIGGTVCARSVKLADGGEGAARAAWWAELRTELRAHARALRCNAVLAYTDTASICEDVCVLSASGTAAVINLDCDFNADIDGPVTVNGSKNAIDELEVEPCSIAHVPYSPGAGPYKAELSACGGCRRARVPAVLLATCAKPSRLLSHAKAVTLTAVAARIRRAPPTSEPGARDISDQLPFLEYELHKLLLAKLRMQGANALFSLQTQIGLGERCVTALASGTAHRLAALPPPTPPRIKSSENDKDALEIQKALWDSFTANRAANGYDIGGTEHNTNGILPEVEGEDAPALDLSADKDACVLELDEAEDVETARSLAKRHVNMQVYTPGLNTLTGALPHAFTQVCRGRLTGVGGAERHVRRALDGVAYKLRRLHPAALANPSFKLELPDDEIQLVISGAAIPLRDPNVPEVNGEEGTHNGDGDDDIFELDEEQLVKQHEVEEKVVPGFVPSTVSLTSLPYISGGRVSVRLCALRLLFVRETTAVRELGGLSGFLHTFTCEVLAIVRAYAAALGGNALTSFYITQLMLQDNAHKNQGQCLLSVGGDIVHITY